MYERPSEKRGHIVGLPNWRLPNLKKQIKDRTLPAMATLLATTRDEFYNAEFDAYAYARYLLFYLQEQGKLTEFYERFVADQTDPTGKAALEAVLGEPLATFEPKWRRWAAALKGDNR
jgi:DNA polymerase III epsilon subunit-like protein